ncbi:MAG: MBL fold metallo-hydrolase [Planctomycetota bacterium]|jgi:glyoxylase-like metal-dependent hydrolase (beta-lactamase superfamily II)
MTTAKARVHAVYGDDVLQCHTWLIAGPDGAVLVDPGSGYWQPEVLAGLAEGGAEPKDVSHVLLTHCHVDHARGAYLCRRNGMQIVSSAYTADVLRAGGHQVWYEFPDKVIPTEVDHVAGDGEVLEVAGLEITVVDTPGHTPGCVSYLVRTARGLAAFTGDLLSGNFQPGWAGSEGFSVPQTIAGIEKLLAAAPDVVYWGHGVIQPPACDWLRKGLELGRKGKWKPSAELHPDVVPPPGR